MIRYGYNKSADADLIELWRRMKYCPNQDIPKRTPLVRNPFLYGALMIALLTFSELNHERIEAGYDSLLNRPSRYLSSGLEDSDLLPTQPAESPIICSCTND
jgi:hypothetical protein